MIKRTPNKTRSCTSPKRTSETTRARKPDVRTRPSGKLGLILDRLEDQRGATLTELIAATGWQKHSVHGALSRLRTQGFALYLDVTEGRKAYRLAQGEN